MERRPNFAFFHPSREGHNDPVKAHIERSIVIERICLNSAMRVLIPLTLTILIFAKVIANVY